MAKDTSHKDRLQEIAEIKFDELSDDEVLQLLAERKQLEELEKEYEAVQKEREKITDAEKEKTELEEKIADLNTRISPDKPDEELLSLINERKELEAKLDTVIADILSFKKKGGAPAPEKVPQKEEKKEEKVATVSEAPAPTKEEKPVEEKALEQPEKAAPPILNLTQTEEFGSGGIVRKGLSPTSEWNRSLEQIKNNLSSIGSILTDLPQAAKKSKDFMLEVAKIDPAYAMHYADKDTLKREEDFNVQVAGMKNPRNSGNALAEMLPEARTSKVVLAGVKQDYKNIRFAIANMVDYDQMLEMARKGALESIKKLKDGVDVTLLIPKVLQKDKAFMEQVEKITGKGK